MSVVIQIVSLACWLAILAVAVFAFAAPFFLMPTVVKRTFVDYLFMVTMIFLSFACLTICFITNPLRF